MNASKEYSFAELINNRSITIPIIQRDYAHGRDDEKVKPIRREFITDVFNSLLGIGQLNGKELDLNFIYGIESKDGKKFLPIDGQQRLTSLYLICWFCAVAEKKTADFPKDKGFDYKIRRTSTSFFKELVNFDEHADDFSKYAQDKNTSMDNFGWFKSLWSFDPTVNGAVNFLDHVRYLYLSRYAAEAEKKGEYFKFTDIMLNEEKCPIRFVYFCQHQPDDSLFTTDHRAALTYINMNARGKVLTDFENLKSLIDGSGEKGKDFAKHYDDDYINIFMDMVEENGDKENVLEGKIARMDECTTDLLLNLYSDLTRLNGLKAPSVQQDETKFTIYSMMDIIREKNEYPEHYFDFIKHIMERCKGNAVERKKVYDYVEKSSYQGRFDLFFTFWYDFRLEGLSGGMDWDTLWDHLGIGTSPDNNDLLDCMYTLVEYIAEARAKDQKNITTLIDCLSEMDPEELFRNNYISKKIRLASLIEEHIKAKMIKADPTRAKLLEETGKRHNHRIRYLLYLSGFWADDTYLAPAGNWNDFEKYAKKDKECAPKNCSLIWKKAYYMQALEQDPKNSGNYLPAKPSSKLTKWDVSCLNWDGKLPDDRKNKLLQNVQKVYDTLGTAYTSPEAYIDDIINKLPNISWLWYVLNREYSDDALFENKVTEVNGTFFYDKENFFTYVLGLDHKHNGYVQAGGAVHTLYPITLRVQKDSVSSKNLYVKLNYTFLFNAGVGYVFQRKDKTFHRYKNTQNPEDTFEFDIDKTTLEVQKKVYDQLAKVVKGIFETYDRSKQPDGSSNPVLTDIIFGRDASVIDTVKKNIVNAVTNLNSNISVENCHLRYNDLIIELKQENIPFVPDAASHKNNAKHEEIYNILK